MSYRTYEEACEAIISKEMARHEVERHGHHFWEFLRDVGIQQQYSGLEVLAWLGY